jgi:hypothetical protein
VVRRTYAFLLPSGLERVRTGVRARVSREE